MLEEARTPDGTSSQYKMVSIVCHPTRAPYVVRSQDQMFTANIEEHVGWMRSENFHVQKTHGVNA